MKTDGLCAFAIVCAVMLAGLGIEAAVIYFKLAGQQHQHDMERMRCMDEKERSNV